MSRIRILPDRVANQIAAGEVVERPVAVVKELVENSLDAGATRIEVEFRQGGKALIRVEDNGGGMTRDEALTALERHATSKLREAEDLNHIASFGFRGEALPSIASVSRFTLRTRTAGQLEGTEILVSAGKLLDCKECGMPVGTVVEVASLFHGVPARRKFLKADATEAANIVQLVRLLAVAHPEVAFVLWEDGRECFRSPGGGRLRERVREVFKSLRADELRELDAQPGPGGVRLHGLVSPPGEGRGSRQDIHVFVNRRPVDSKLVTAALVEAYQGVMPRGRYPAALLFVDLPPEAVDVNVHPTKREVRFRDEVQVRSAVILAVQDLLKAATAAARPVAPAVVPPPVAVPGPGDAARQWAAQWLEQASAKAAAKAEAKMAAARAPDMAGTPDTAGEGAMAGATDNAGVAGPETPAGGAGAAGSSGAGIAATGRETAGAGPARFGRCLGRVREDYAIFEMPGGLGILHRRGARARIEYETVRRRVAAGEVAAQPLLFAVPLEMDAPSAAALEEGREFLESNGFTVAPFGRQFYRIEAIPDWAAPEEAETLVRDLVAGFRERGGVPVRKDLAAERLAREAAGRASRREAAATPAELERLAAELFSCEQPLADPDGRPTFQEIAWPDLSRRFGRSG